MYRIYNNKMHLLESLHKDPFQYELYCKSKDLVNAQFIHTLITDNDAFPAEHLKHYILCEDCLNTYPNKEELGMLLLKVLE